MTSIPLDPRDGDTASLRFFAGGGCRRADWYGRRRSCGTTEVGRFFIPAFLHGTFDRIRLHGIDRRSAPAVSHEPAPPRPPGFAVSSRSPARRGSCAGAFSLLNRRSATRAISGACRGLVGFPASTRRKLFHLRAIGIFSLVSRRKRRDNAGRSPVGGQPCSGGAPDGAHGVHPFAGLLPPAGVGAFPGVRSLVRTTRSGLVGTFATVSGFRPSGPTCRWPLVHARRYRSGDRPS